MLCNSGWGVQRVGWGESRKEPFSRSSKGEKGELTNQWGWFHPGISARVRVLTCWEEGEWKPFLWFILPHPLQKGSEQIRKLMLAGRFRRALPLPGQVPLPWVSPLRTRRSGSLSSMLLTPFTKVVPTFFHPSFFSWHPRNFLDFSGEEIINCSGMGTVFHLVL